jgi:hypothetical protein
MSRADAAARAAYKQQWADQNRDKVRASKARYKAKNPERYREQQAAWTNRNRDKINAQHARMYAENADRRLQALVRGAKHRAKILGVSFNLSHREIVWPVVCPVLGIPINYGIKGGKQEWGSPSLDRFDPKGGYTKDNVRVVSWRANFLKCNATVSEMEMLVAYLSKGE